MKGKNNGCGVETSKNNIMPYMTKYKRMLEKVKKETKWKDIFKIVEEAQRRLRRNERNK
jgi:hypothetical protein